MVTLPSLLLSMCLHMTSAFEITLKSNKINEVCFPNTAELKCPRGFVIEFDDSSVVVGRGGPWERMTKCGRVKGEDTSKCRERNYSKLVKSECSGIQVCTIQWPDSEKRIYEEFNCHSSPYLTLLYRCKPISKSLVENAKKNLVKKLIHGNLSEVEMKKKVKHFFAMSVGIFAKGNLEPGSIEKGIQDIEEIGLSIGERLGKSKSYIQKQFKTKEVDMLIEVTNTSHTWSSNNSEVLLPVQIPGRKQVHVLTRLVNSAILLQSQADVISVVLNGHHHRSLEENLWFTLPHSSGRNYKFLQCGYWASSANHGLGYSGRWDSEGCYTHVRNETHVVCSCNHLTSFSLFWSLENQVAVDEAQFEVLDWVSRIGLIISLIALVISMGTFLWINTGARTDRDRIHLHLCFSLFLLQLIFLTGIDATEHVWGCKLIAVLLHYLYLTTLVWSFLEGLEVWNMLHRVFTTGYARRKSMLLAGYAPALLLVSCAVFYDLVLHLITSREISYGTETFCWIRLDTKFNLWFLVPASVLVILNFGFLLYAIYFIRKYTEKYNSFSILQLAKGLMALVFLLGSNFTLGFLYMFFQSFYLALFFNLLNALQGVGILIFQIVLNPSMTTAISRKLRAGISSYFGAERLPSSQNGADKVYKISGGVDMEDSKTPVSSLNTESSASKPDICHSIESPFTPSDAANEVISTSHLAISTAHQALSTAHKALSTAQSMHCLARERGNAPDTASYVNMSSSELYCVKKSGNVNRQSSFSSTKLYISED